MGRMTSHIWSGKIKFMFETTNQIVYSVTLPKTPGFTFLRPTFCQNIRKRTEIHQDLRPDVGIVTRMTCNHKNKPANFLPAMLLIHWARHWARPSCAPAAPGAWNCFGQVRFGIAESLATGAAISFRSVGQKLGNSLNGKLVNGNFRIRFIGGTYHI